jgi:NAD(P)-dependent dehydrogenase (short-subunit alcohol dehydrogenase family)
MAEAGAAVCLVSRKRRDLEAVAAEIESAGGQALICEADVADATRLHEPVDAVAARWGRLDILVNNAGIAPAEPSAASDDFEVWEALLRVNLNAVFRLSRLAGRAMIERRRGSIVNIGSIGGASALVASQPGYCATKAALAGLTTALAAEWAAHGVRVNTVAPGYIATDRLYRNRDEPGDPQRQGLRGGRDREDTPGALRHAGGDRLAGRVSSLLEGRVCHRPDLVCRRRMEHAVTLPPAGDRSKPCFRISDRVAQRV